MYGIGSRKDHASQNVPVNAASANDKHFLGKTITNSLLKKLDFFGSFDWLNRVSLRASPESRSSSFFASSHSSTCIFLLGSDIPAGE